MPAVSLLVALLAAPPATPVSFRTQVAPLLRRHCLACHGGGRKRGGLSLASRAAVLAGGDSGPAVRPGRAADSLLFQHVHAGRMPPRRPLGPAAVAVLRRWIDAGAKWDGPPLPAGPSPADHWSLWPVRRPPVPRIDRPERVRTPIDAFLLPALEAQGLSFSPPADRATILRRVCFDLTGLPPTPEEIDTFLADGRPDAYERLVDRLLASPAYGERWGRHWLDVVRFAESHGYEMNTLRPTAWPYRDYVIAALNGDVRYRRFVREQLAGDVVGQDPTAAAATGFLVAGPHDMVGNQTLEGRLQIRGDDLFDMVATTSATFLGLTAGCARCHDHKFDPIRQKEFYALEAVFAGVEHAERDLAPAGPDRLARAGRLRRRLAALDRQADEQAPLAGGGGPRPGVDPVRNVDRFAPVRARFVRFVIAATTDGSEPCIDELELYGPGGAGNLALAGRGVKASASSVFPNNALHRLEHLNDGRVGNGRSWISAQRGKGWVRLELPAEALLDRVVWGRDREGRYRDRLAKDYHIETSADGTRWTKAADSSDRLPPGTAGAPPAAVQKVMDERRALLGELQALNRPRRAYAGAFRTPDVIHRLERGDVLQKREVVAPGGIAAVGPALRIPPRATGPERRRALADWVTHDDNPLAWRVMANRLWHGHFGQGLVRTPSDFGANGDRPSHPELLDWLASEFRSSGGRMKHLHRLIVLSAAYRQQSRHAEGAARLDADNRLLWRGPTRRLEAEAVRDAMLQVSGALDRRMGGPGYHLWDYSGYVIVFTPKAKLGPEAFRRMVYQFKPRLQQDRTFGAFDCPDATAATPRRNVSTTPLQALNLLNDPFVLGQAGRFADRVRREAGPSRAEQVRRAFRLALGRPPSAAEAGAAEQLVGRHGLALLCRTLFNTNEFVFVH
jgi:hypothetical protein